MKCGDKKPQALLAPAPPLLLVVVDTTQTRKRYRLVRMRCEWRPRLKANAATRATARVGDRARAFRLDSDMTLCPETEAENLRVC